MAKAFGGLGVTTGVAADRTGISSPFAGQQFFETDTKLLYIYDGAAWVTPINLNTPVGLVAVKPTSVSGSGVSLSGFKTTISGATAATINGVFTSAFTSYHILFSRMGNTTYPYIVFQLTASGTPSTASYGSGRISGQPDLVGYSSVGGSNAPFAAGGNSLTLKPNIIKMDLDGPALSAHTSHIVIGSGDYAQVEIYAGTHQVATSYDGIKVFSSDNSAFDGRLVVYGWNGS